MVTHVMTGVEIFSEGTWNGRTFGPADLDSMESSFTTLGLSGRIPLKLGHEGPDDRELDEDSPLRQFALGWVKKVYREGKKLLCDWEIPEQVHKWIDSGMLRHVSVELLPNVQAGTRVIPWVLDAVALLGSDQPAVGILKDLKESMARRATHSSHGERVNFSRVGVINNLSGDNEDMSDAVKELADQLAALRVEMSRKDDRIAALEKVSTKQRETEGQLTALQQQVQKDKVLAHRASLVDRLEAAVKAEDIQPKVRANFITVYGVEDDDQVLKVTTEQVEDFIKANPNPFKKRETKKVVSLSKADGDLPAGTPADQELVLRVEARLRERDIYQPTADDIQRETLALFRANPELGERYKASVNVAINHPHAQRQ